MIFGESTSMFGGNIIDQEFSNPDTIIEAFIVDEVSQLPDEKIQEFCQPGGVGEQLVQEGRLKKKNKDGCSSFS